MVPLEIITTIKPKTLCNVVYNGLAIQLDDASILQPAEA
jgi:hypothetical protein